MIIQKKCICGKIFKTYDYRIREGRGKFCNIKCKYKYAVRPSGLKYNLKVINPTWFKKGRKYIPVIYTDEIRKKISEANKGKRRSIKTEFKYINGNGYRHLLYKGILRQECEECDETNIKRLHVHHIDHNRKNNNINNLMVLCRPCHLSKHNRIERVYVEGRKAV